MHNHAPFLFLNGMVPGVEPKPISKSGTALQSGGSGSRVQLKYCIG